MQSNPTVLWVVTSIAHSIVATVVILIVVVRYVRRIRALERQLTRYAQYNAAIVQGARKVHAECARLKRESDEFSDARTVFRAPPESYEPPSRDASMAPAYGAPPPERLPPEPLEPLNRTYLGMPQASPSKAPRSLRAGLSRR